MNVLCECQSGNRPFAGLKGNAKVPGASRVKPSSLALADDGLTRPTLRTACAVIFKIGDNERGGNWEKNTHPIGRTIAPIAASTTRAHVCKTK